MKLNMLLKGNQKLAQALVEPGSFNMAIFGQNSK